MPLRWARITQRGVAPRVRFGDNSVGGEFLKGAQVMKTSAKALGAFFILAVAAAIVTTAQSGPQVLRVGLIPERNVFDQVGRYETLAEHLSAELEPDFELTMLSRYGNIVERITRREVHAAFLGSFTGALAAAQLDMEPVARPVNRDGTSTYLGRIFVRADSGIETVADMKGKRLALVERATTAGYVFPLAFLKANGVDDLEAYFTEVRFWGSHDATVAAVLAGRADVGAAKNTVMDWQAERDPRIGKELRILAFSSRVPSNGLFVSALVDRRLKEEIRDVLVNLHVTPQGQRILSRLGAQKFELTQTEDYRPVFDLAAAAGIDVEHYSYINE